MEGFEKVCHINDLEEKEGKRFMVNDVDIALFKLKDKVYALNNICPHQHLAVMHDGYVYGGHVSCPMHGWSFNLKDGKINGRKGLDSYEVKIIDNEVYVKAEAKEPEWDW